MNRSTTASAPRADCEPYPREYRRSLEAVGYIPRLQAEAATYAALGFKSGLEIHQQLLTEKKLFCHCPAGLFQHDKYDAEVIRHMRPTLSEMGEYDGTALMEKRTRKNIVYRIKAETACTYDIDDTPPFKINRQALDIALEIGLMLNCSIVGELHITRKQYLDGSIPTGFQRTAIIGIEGEIPLKTKKVRLIQMSIEEDSCREVSDIGHTRIYTTDRLGMPLIESVTYPEMLTPDEVAEAAQYLRLLVRSSGKVRTGIGAARQDVNVSIDGGTRVEIKGVAHIKWIPELTHVEAFRQKALLTIRTELQDRVAKPEDWKISSVRIEPNRPGILPSSATDNLQPDDRVVAVNLPHFEGLLSHFTQPGQCFANEISDRLKVIACLERPNLIHSEQADWLEKSAADDIKDELQAGDNDAQLIFWGPEDDIATALETIEERCQLAFEGVPNETRKSLPDGTTLFERVLPGPDRMYPDTDSAPIPIDDERMGAIEADVRNDLPDWYSKLREWEVPEDAHAYLIRNESVPEVARIAEATGWSPRFVALLFGHTARGALRRSQGKTAFKSDTVAAVCSRVAELKYDPTVARLALGQIGVEPTAALDSELVGSLSLDEAAHRVKELADNFDSHATSRLPEAKLRWIIGQLRPQVEGRVKPSELADRVAKELNHD